MVNFSVRVNGAALARQSDSRATFGQAKRPTPVTLYCFFLGAGVSMAQGGCRVAGATFWYTGSARVRGGRHH